MVLAVLLIGLQFYPVLPPTLQYVDRQTDFLVIEKADDTLKHLFQIACYDCHSYQVVYPWYAKIAPLSFPIAHHINEGREKLNFSTWSSYKPQEKWHQLSDMMELLEKDEMPLYSYKLLHSEATLSATQKQHILDFCKDRMKQYE